MRNETKHRSMINLIYVYFNTFENLNVLDKFSFKFVLPIE